MAIVTVYGMTASGKSHYSEKEYLKKSNRCIVLDKMHCFSGGDIVTVFNRNDISKLFRRYKNQKSFKLIIRPKRGTNISLICDFLISLSCALGRTLGPYNEKNRIWLVVDEADSVVSSNYQSERIKHLVNYGRHDNVDSLFIARNPMRLHTDIRSNASKIVTFNLSNAPQIPDFRNNFGREVCKKIQTLNKYHFMSWLCTGEIFETDSKGRELK
jgi:hypothetical protein